MLDDLLNKLRFQEGRRAIIFRDLRATETPIIDRRTDRTEVRLEVNKTGVIEVGTAEIELLHTFGFTVLNRVPEQGGYRAQIMNLFIRTAVLVYQCFLVSKREDAGNGTIAGPGDPDRQLISETID